MLAANSNQCTGIKNKHTKSEVTAIHTNNIEKACKRYMKIKLVIHKQIIDNLLTKPLYLKESCTERSSNQNGQRNSNRNINIKSAVITKAQSIKNFIYKTVVLK